MSGTASLETTGTALLSIRDGQYFRVADYRGNLGCLLDVYLVGRQSAVKLASKHNAPGSAPGETGREGTTYPNVR